MDQIDMGVLRYRIQELKLKESRPLYPHIALNDERQHTLLWLSKINSYLEDRVCSPNFDKLEVCAYLYFTYYGFVKKETELYRIREELIDFIDLKIKWISRLESGVKDRELPIHAAVRGIENDWIKVYGYSTLF